MNIYKYSLPPMFCSTNITVPEHSYPLTAQLQDNQLVIWFAQPETNLRDTNLSQFRVSVVPTGNSVLEEGIYLSTIQISPLVYHVFWHLID